MRYIVECRNKDQAGNISVFTFNGFGAGLPDKKMANDIFIREKSSNKWDAVYIDKIYTNGSITTEKSWYKESEQ